MIRPSTLIKHSPDRTPGSSGPDWMKDAACAGQIDDWAWFDHGKNDEPYALAEVRLSCDVCPVRAACLEYALEHERDHGNWAGFTPKQRANIRRKRDRKSQAKGAA